MANVGRYIERNPDMRAAGLTSFEKSGGELYGSKECFMIVNLEEEAENRIRALCRLHKAKPYGKRTPKIPTDKMGDIFSNQDKGLFAEFQEKFRENMFFKKPLLGQATESNSKPDSVTNLSRTFGQASDPEESLYSVVMPPKSAEQVNREYGEFHDKHIISHNHYFPSEQINRRYSSHFNRLNTFGMPFYVDHTGIKVKRCLHEGEEHLIIVKKPQMDLDDRTKGPLGKKYKWYPYQIPENMTFGRTMPREADMRSLLENTSPSILSEKLASAISHLNMLRKMLQERDDFNMNQVIVALEKKDKEGNRQLPLTEIIHVMRKLNIPADAEKIRTAVSHFRLIVDEGCCSERVKYEDLCHLLSILKSLPMIGSISPMPKAIYNQDTAYRQLCADLLKKPPEGPNFIHTHKSPVQKDLDDTHVKDVLNPDLPTLCGLWPSDFNVMRCRDEIERIFQSIVSKDDFERIWFSLTAEQKDQNEMASVAQFRAEMKKIS
ncbi:EF-hand domain-containing family member B [Drosophila rhopaloa]|uniref:EFHB C-terminal EF-hand domain-containing protein n=1 Tax=Drosophila rhopaloa TaxID=1041015 RepID=A0ABM5HPL9_DRORH|nr:EF-hand domain-containing family member B [Drosophila rhopaloa]